MRRVAETRPSGQDLLVRPPCPAQRADHWAGAFVDPVEQLKTLADLVTRGLLWPEEYERHKARILEP